MNIKEESNNLQNQKVKFKIEENYMFYICLFLFGLSIMMLRNADLFAQNTLYAEDGAWLGKMYNEGFWYTLLHTRTDYFVFGNVIMLKLSDIANYIFFGDDISRIPMFIAFGQYFIYIGLALSTVICLRKRIDLATRIIIYLLIIFLPFGGAAGYFEIPGRILNVGFIFFPLALCFLVYRLDFKEIFSLKKLILIDFLIYICVTTNPTCYALMPVFFLIDLYEQYNKSKENIKFKKFDDIKKSIGILFKENYMRSWIVLAVALTISLAYCTFILPSSQDVNADTAFTIELFVECMIHSLIFQFIFPFYGKLTFTIGSILLTAIVVFIFGGLYFMPKVKRRNFAVIVTICTFIYIFATLITRKQLYPFLVNYQNIFPERYYYSQNVMSIIMFFTILSGWERVAKRKMALMVTCIPLLIVYGLSFQQLFYSNGNIDLSKSFCTKLTQADLTVQGNGSIVVPIEPNVWTTSIPLDKYMASLQRKRREQNITLSNINDENWIGGVSTHLNVLLFPNDIEKNLRLLKSEPKTVSADGYKVNITQIEEMGDYIWVFINEDADKMRFQYPAEIILE